MLDAEAMRAAATSMDSLWAKYPGGPAIRPTAGAGPYAIVSTTSPLPIGVPWPVTQLAQAFHPVAFPYWYRGRPATRGASTARLACDGTVWVVPEFARSLLSWCDGEDFQVFEAQSVAGLPDPPDEDVMGAWLTTQLTTQMSASQGRRLAWTTTQTAQLAGAVADLGWAQVAQVVMALPDPQSQTPGTVTAYLCALASVPPSSARWPGLGTPR